jgi:formylglycine-generating enzyme required for sulfatase activity
MREERQARAVGLVVVVIAAAVVLQACGKKPPAGDKTESPKPVTTAPAAGGAAPKTATPAGPGQTMGKDGAPMVEIPAGEFVMGSDSGEPDERPVHRVKLKAFRLDVYPVTNAQFAAFLDEIKSSRDDDGHLLVWTFRRGVHKVGSRWEPQKDCDRYPAIGVTWHGAAAYAKHYGERLPTEAEWEYACRAGSKTTWSFGSEVGRLVDFVWFRKNAGDEIHPVGEKPANAWGIWDMPGSVWEWCSDWYDEDYYSMSQITNPKGPSARSYRVLRGGSRLNSAAKVRSANRGASPPDDKDGTIGFRCAARAE